MSSSAWRAAAAAYTRFFFRTSFFSGPKNLLTRTRPRTRTYDARRPSGHDGVRTARPVPLGHD